MRLPLGVGIDRGTRRRPAPRQRDQIDELPNATAQRWFSSRECTVMRQSRLAGVPMGGIPEGDMQRTTPALVNSTHRSDHISQATPDALVELIRREYTAEQRDTLVRLLQP